MDDEIDIEEHDILDDPRIRKLFPDVSQIKIEVHNTQESLLVDKIQYEEENIEEQTDTQELILPDLEQNYFETPKIIEEAIEISDDLEEVDLVTKGCERVSIDGKVRDDEKIREDVDVENGDYKNAPKYAKVDYEKVPNYEKDTNYENATNDNANYVVPLEYQESSGYSNSDDFHIKEEIDYENYDDNELPPEDIYHFKNKIILGTKPCNGTSPVSFFNNNFQDTRKEHLPVSVVLEDWQDRLENSLTYCKPCERLFATQNSLDAHKSISHSLLVAVTKNVALKSTTKVRNIATKSTSPKVKNQARKSTGKSKVSMKFCNHCSQEFPDDTSLIKHLYELLPLTNFNCQKCDAVFNSQKELTDHNAHHIKVEKGKIEKNKVQVRKNKVSVKISKGKVIKNKFVVSKVNGLVGNKVQTGKSAVQVGKKNVQSWKNKIQLGKNKVQSGKEVSRKKLLFEEDLKKPKERKGFSDFVIPKSVLFQCGRCKMCFFTCTGGRAHYNKDVCLGTPTEACFDCEICKCKIKVSNAAIHKKQHEISTKIKIYKISNHIYDRVLTECPQCHVYFTEQALLRHFREKKCGKLETIYCRKCETHTPEMSFRYHKQKHDKGFTKRDFILVQNIMQNKRKNARKIVKTTKTAVIPKINDQTHIKQIKGKNIRKLVKATQISVIPKTGDQTQKVNMKRQYKNGKILFYFCKKCKSVCKKKLRMLHIKNSCLRFKTMVCDKCGLQVRNEDMGNHTKLHHYKEFNIHDILFQNAQNLRPVNLSLPNYHQCKHCMIKFNHEKALQSHTCGENYRNCICGDKFDMTAYKAHVEYHKLTEQQNVPEPKLVKKTDKPLLYRCINCDISTDIYDNAVEHSQNHDKTVKNRRTIKCYICNLKFDEISWHQHSTLHSKTTITNADFKVLTYNPDDLLTDEWVKLFQNLSAAQTREIIKSSLYSIERSVPMKLIKNGRIEYTLYVCSQCEICFQNSEITTHISEKCTQSSKHLCKICLLKFKDSNALQYHVLLHKGVKNEDFRIVHFVKNTKAYVIYKCSNCKCCLRRKDSITKHNCTKQLNRNYSCLICNQVYPKNHRLIHEKIHDDDSDFHEKNIEIEYFVPLALEKPNNKDNNTQTITGKVYKCECGLHFTSLQTVAKHSDNCNPDAKIHAEKCSKCNLLFPTDILVSHLCKHHSNNTKISVEEYKVQSTTVTPIKTPIKNYDYKLYKCKICDMYFHSQSTCYTHVTAPHKRPDILHECHICGLQFTAKSLYIHKRKHHDKYFNLNRVLVEEYHPATESSPIKIDIYMAVDKLQSLLVSSST